MASWKTPVLAALMCAHCALTAVAVVAAAGLSSLPPLFGIGWDYVLPPLFLLGLFLGWVLWSGREAAACDVPERPS